jgi:hypothetical protein
LLGIGLGVCVGVSVGVDVSVLVGVNVGVIVGVSVGKNPPTKGADFKSHPLRARVAIRYVIVNKRFIV